MLTSAPETHVAATLSVPTPSDHTDVLAELVSTSTETDATMSTSVSDVHAVATPLATTPSAPTTVDVELVIL